MLQTDTRIRVLFIDSGGGYGGPTAFLCYLLTHLDKEKCQPFVAFYLRNRSDGTVELQRIGVPVFFLGTSQKLTNYIQTKLLAGPSKSRLLHLSKVAIRLLSRLVLVEMPQLWRLLRILKTQQMDLIVLNNDVHYHRVAALAATISGVPCICRKAGGIGEGKRIKKFLTPCVDLFIAISAATARDQMENNPSTKKAVIIYEGIDLGKFTPSSVHPEVLQGLGILSGKKVVGYISRLVEGKGHREFIEAAVSIRNRYNDVVFLIVGADMADQEGAFMKQLRRRVDDLGLGDCVIFAGWRTDIPEILSVVDVFVHCPTSWLEGLGIAHLEAMAMGVPTVVSSNGGLPDAAVDGVTGFIVPPGNIEKLAARVINLLEDEGLALRLGRNARARVEDLFDASKNTIKLEGFFKEYSQVRKSAFKWWPLPHFAARRGHSMNQSEG